MKWPDFKFPPINLLSYPKMNIAPMTEEEYYKKIKALKDDFDREMSIVRNDYAMSNNTVQIGDIISDYVNIIRVNKIRTYNSDNSTPPKCIYSGDKITKKGTVSKTQPTAIIYQGNLKK